MQLFRDRRTRSAGATPAAANRSATSGGEPARYELLPGFEPASDVVLDLSGAGRAFVDTRGFVVPDSVLHPLIQVRPEYIKACFEEIELRYKSKQHFYKEALGLDETARRGLWQLAAVGVGAIASARDGEVRLARAGAF